MAREEVSNSMGKFPIHFDPLDPAQREDPFPIYARLRNEQPVFYSSDLGLWVVSRYDDVKTVLKDPDTFSSANALKSTSLSLPSQVLEVLEEGHPEMPIIVDSDPPDHQRIRSLVSKAFTPKRIARMEPRIETIANELLDTFVSDGAADIIDQFTWPLPLRVIGDMIGVPREDLPQLHQWSTEWLMMQQGTGSIEQQVAYARSYVEFQRYFIEALKDRSQNPRDDLMTALVQARLEDEAPLSIVEVAGIPLDLIVAGHVTVTRVLGSALVLLLNHPEQFRLLREGTPELLTNAIEEILRMESPAQGLFRITTLETSLGGVTLPKGAHLMVHFGSANRDEDVFSGPESFDIQRRDLNKHIAFGHGIHHCIGAPLGRLELKTVLPILFDRLPGLRLQPNKPTERDPVFFARGFTHLHVEWDVD